LQLRNMGIPLFYFRIEIVQVALMQQRKDYLRLIFNWSYY
jgi:hypothetical protein